MIKLFGFIFNIRWSNKMIFLDIIPHTKLIKLKSDIKKMQSKYPGMYIHYSGNMPTEWCRVAKCVCLRHFTTWKEGENFCEICYDKYKKPLLNL